MAAQNTNSAPRKEFNKQNGTLGNQIDFKGLKKNKQIWA